MNMLSQITKGHAKNVLADLNNNYYYIPVKNGRSGEIRTPGPLVPNQMRYQAALHSDPSTNTAVIDNFNV